MWWQLSFLRIHLQSTFENDCASTNTANSGRVLRNQRVQRRQVRSDRLPQLNFLLEHVTLTSDFVDLLLEVGFYFGKLCGLEVLELLCTLLLDLPDGVVAFRFNLHELRVQISGKRKKLISLFLDMSAQSPLCWQNTYFRSWLHTCWLLLCIRLISRTLELKQTLQPCICRSLCSQKQIQQLCLSTAAFLEKSPLRGPCWPITLEGDHVLQTPRVCPELLRIRAGQEQSHLPLTKLSTQPPQLCFQLGHLVP
mmetsp:Transcript_89916/g.124891  ORF Transcript_89916/g.124891 Transcript_89916/m.124891 type:complete len:252 (+) Transcript_89916:90-845(+)